MVVNKPTAYSYVQVENERLQCFNDDLHAHLTYLQDSHQHQAAIIKKLRTGQEEVSITAPSQFCPANPPNMLTQYATPQHPETILSTEDAVQFRHQGTKKLRTGEEKVEPSECSGWPAPRGLSDLSTAQYQYANTILSTDVPAEFRNIGETEFPVQSVGHGKNHGLLADMWRAACEDQLSAPNSGEIASGPIDLSNIDNDLFEIDTSLIDPSHGSSHSSSAGSAFGSGSGACQSNQSTPSAGVCLSEYKQTQKQSSLLKAFSTNLANTYTAWIGDHNAVSVMVLIGLCVLSVASRQLCDHQANVLDIVLDRYGYHWKVLGVLALLLSIACSNEICIKWMHQHVARFLMQAFSSFGVTQFPRDLPQWQGQLVSTFRTPVSIGCFSVIVFHLSAGHLIDASQVLLATAGLLVAHIPPHDHATVVTRRKVTTVSIAPIFLTISTLRASGYFSGTTVLIALSDPMHHWHGIFLYPITGAIIHDSVWAYANESFLMNAIIFLDPQATGAMRVAVVMSTVLSFVVCTSKILLLSHLPCDSQSKASLCEDATSIDVPPKLGSTNSSTDMK